MLDVRKMFCSEDGEMVEHVAKRICGYPIIGSVKSQLSWSLEQPDLMTDVPANGRVIGLDGLWKYQEFDGT